MLLNILALTVVLLLSISAGWTALRVRRRNNIVVKWGATGLFSFLTLFLALMSVLVSMGIVKAYAPRGNPVEERAINPSPELIARGEHLARVTCSTCHADEPGELPLSGGPDIFRDVPIPLGSATPPNLTPTGGISEWTNGEIARAIREGTNRDGHLMPVMATQTYRVFSDEDLDSIIAYLRSQPPGGSGEEPRQSLTPVSMVGLVLGMFPVREVPDVEFPQAVPMGPTVEYGEYIAGFIDCAICHGDDLSGVPQDPIAPRAPNLVTVKSWTAEQFIRTMRTGESPTRGPLDPDQMPWRTIGLLSDAELTALYEYVLSVR